MVAETVQDYDYEYDDENPAITASEAEEPVDPNQLEYYYYSDGSGSEN